MKLNVFECVQKMNPLTAEVKKNMDCYKDAI